MPFLLSGVNRRESGCLMVVGAEAPQGFRKVQLLDPETIEVCVNARKGYCALSASYAVTVSAFVTKLKCECEV